MKALSPRVCWTTIFALLVLGVASFGVGRWIDAESEWPPSSSVEPETDVADQRRRREELDVEQEELLRRVAAKERILAKLLAGRLTLWQAAQRFRAAHTPRPMVFHPAVVAAFRNDHPGASPTREVLLCMEVFERALGELQERIDWKGRTTEADAVRARLKRELQEILKEPVPLAESRLHSP